VPMTDADVPERSTRHHDRIVDLLGSRVVSGLYREGELLPREEEFVEELDVSRGVVREAIRVLSSKGLVDPRPRRGTKVLPKEDWNQLDPTVIRWRSEGAHNGKYLMDLMELREMIEPIAAGYAAERARRADLAVIDAAVREMWLVATDEQALIEADLRFHNALLIAAQNDLVIQISSAVEASMRMGRDVTVSIGHSLRLAEHQAVADAVLARSKGRARKAMALLLELSTQDLLEALRLAHLDAEVQPSPGAPSPASSDVA
jgi:GntR family transcriptional regulator, galactonate operon transcriptional repressor